MVQKRAESTIPILHCIKIQLILSLYAHFSSCEGVVSDQQCIDQTAFQPVVHLYFTSVHLVR